jgi:hypothetical protein
LSPPQAAQRLCEYVILRRTAPKDPPDLQSTARDVGFLVAALLGMTASLSV